VLLSHSFLSHNCSYYHQTTKNGQSRHNNWKYRKFIKNFRPSSSPRRENGSKHSTILTTELSTHQTKQPKPFQEATILTVVTSFKQDLKNSQLIIILYGFYVETSWHHSNNLRRLTKQRRHRRLRSRLRSRLRRRLRCRLRSRLRSRHLSIPWTFTKTQSTSNEDSIVY